MKEILLAESINYTQQFLNAHDSKSMNQFSHPVDNIK